jgi:hypothetical protein
MEKYNIMKHIKLFENYHSTITVYHKSHFEDDIMRSGKGIFTFTRPSINIVGGKNYFALDINPVNTYQSENQFTAFEELFPDKHVHHFIGGTNYEIMDSMIAKELKHRYDSILYNIPLVAAKVGKEWVILDDSIITNIEYIGNHRDCMKYAYSKGDEYFKDI